MYLKKEIDFYGWWGFDFKWVLFEKVGLLYFKFYLEKVKVWFLCSFFCLLILYVWMNFMKGNFVLNNFMGFIEVSMVKFYFDVLIIYIMYRDIYLIKVDMVFGLNFCSEF